MSLSWKTIAVFFLLFFFGVIIAAAIEGGGGMAATKLTAKITATATTIPVINTNGFLSGDVIVIENERILYTGKNATNFNVGVVRGYDATTAKQHESGMGVYTRDTNILNQALGYNVITVKGQSGDINFGNVFWDLITESVPRILSWDFNWLKNGIMQYVRYVLMIISVGFVWSLLYAIGVLLSNAVSSILKLF